MDLSLGATDVLPVERSLEEALRYGHHGIDPERGAGDREIDAGLAASQQLMQRPMGQDQGQGLKDEPISSGLIPTVTSERRNAVAGDIEGAGGTASQMDEDQPGGVEAGQAREVSGRRRPPGSASRRPN